MPDFVPRFYARYVRFVLITRSTHTCLVDFAFAFRSLVTGWLLPSRILPPFTYMHSLPLPVTLLPPAAELVYYLILLPTFTVATVTTGRYDSRLTRLPLVLMIVRTTLPLHILFVVTTTL